MKDNYYILECRVESGREPSGADRKDTPLSYNFGWGWPSRRHRDVMIECYIHRRGVIMPIYYADSVYLMRDDLLEAVLEAGVDNLQVFPAILEDKYNKTTYTNYKGVNVVGLINAADKKTKKLSLDDEGFFGSILDGTYIDTTMPDGTLMFRLNESVGALVIHERVKRSIEKHNIPHMRFCGPGEWHG